MNSARFNGAVNTESTLRAAGKGYQNPVYAATLNVAAKVNDAITLVNVQQLTGALTVNAGVGDATTPPMIGDELHFYFATDGTQRIVTFGTGIVSAGTVTIPASKTAQVRFMFNGAAWAEYARAITA